MSPRSQESGGRRQGRASSYGRGKGYGGGRGSGPGGECICPACGERSSHKRGTPCFDLQCPKCGASMSRKP